MDAYRTLFDLSIGLNKTYDNKLKNKACRLFHLLSTDDRIELVGLLYNKAGNPFYQKKTPQTRAEAIEQANYFFHSVFNHENYFLSKHFINFKWTNFFKFSQPNTELQFFDLLFYEVIWRSIFSDSLDANLQWAVFKNSFCYTDLAIKQPYFLNAKNYDFVIFNDIETLKISKNVINILYVQDTLAESSCFYSYIKHIYKDSYLVFESDSMRNKLIKVYPYIKEKSEVIPYHEEAQSISNNISSQWIKLFEKIKLK